MPKYYLGIDGGGSKTAFLCTDEYGTKISSCILGGSYCGQDGLVTVLERLKEGVGRCLPEDADDVLACFGMPSFGENKTIDAEAVRYFSEELKPVKLMFENDAVIGWAASTAMNPGVSIVSGTGTIGYGRDEYGNEARCGGWHEFFSDEGSGYWLGRQLLGLFSKQSDGRLPRTELYYLVKERLGLDDDFYINELCASRYVHSRKATAELQTILFEAAEKGDKYALECYEKAVTEMALIIKTLLSKLNFDNDKQVLLSYTGGLFNANELIKIPLENKLKEEMSESNIVFESPRLSPCEGAILLAAYEAGMKTFETVRNNLLRKSD